MQGVLILLLYKTKMNDRKTIYVSIVSYRDKLLIKTIESLLNTKSNKHNIVIGVIEQISNEDSIIFNYPEILNNNCLIKKNNDINVEFAVYDNAILYKRYDPQYTQGVGWARFINQYQIAPSQYDFLYQIDSHMLFDDNWDEILLNDYYTATNKVGHDKVIITSPCKSFDVDAEGNIIDYKTNINWRGDIKFLKEFNGYIYTAVGELFPSDGNIYKSIHICAGNSLFPAQWVFDVGNNIESFFSGEEHLLTIKSIVNGYELFNMSIIPSYHYINTSDYETKPHKSPIIDKLTYDRYTIRSVEVLSDYINSLSKKELQRYYKYSGVNLKDKTINEESLSKIDLKIIQSSKDNWKNYKN